ncbi:MAG: L-aspartate oxidase [Candidatus Hydrogenedentota bacterium]|nr:MAG: L-aspartate oxidase [Candidatus Hydrogenedentota bacterium]
MNAEGACSPVVVVVGSGIAGLRHALYLAEKHDVVLITKKAAVESNTNYAQGGIAVALGADDAPELHIEDTLRTGAGLTDPKIAEIVVREGPELVRELVEMGADFARDERGELALGREGGHSRNRVIHSADQTGREVERVLLHHAESHPRITLRPYHFVIDLLVNEGKVSGVAVLTPDEEIEVIPTSVVSLSTGGLGRIFLYTTNPEIATGDGVAMAYRAGARIRDMEFIQFHPTALARPGSAAFLISEAVRGEGGILRTLDGERFMERYDPERMELAPRDVVARAIDTELKKRGDPYVLLDVTHLGKEFLQKRFPHIYRTCLVHDIAIEKDPIPVVPAAHYSCGGIVTDANGRTDIVGLYAIGETASHGLHGANRLASNSLLEALVFARRAARAIHADGLLTPAEQSRRIPNSRSQRCGLVDLYAGRLRTVMSQKVGIFRNRAALSRAEAEIEAIRVGLERLVKIFRPTRDLLELFNMAEVARLIVRSALARTRSVGLHALEEDGGRQDPAPRHTVWQRKEPTNLLGELIREKR